KDNPYHPIPYAFEDFALAYIAAENGFGIVSYDHHLLLQIKKYLDYDCYWPQDIDKLPADSIILLDTNILIHLIEKEKSDRKSEIIKMFEKNPSITFLLTDHIFKELSLVYEKKFGKEDTQEQKQPELGKYIDNFDGFETNHRHRLNMRRKKNNPCKKPVNVCIRYRKLYRSLN
ncbi:MAG: hypothetical protein ACTSXY_03770, partial [Promethearchaeota archaeon]